MTAEETETSGTEAGVQEQSGLEELRKQVRDAGIIGRPQEVADENPDTGADTRGDESESEDGEERGEQAKSGAQSGAKKDDDEDAILDEDVKNPQAENFRKLQGKAKDWKGKAKEYERQLEELKRSRESERASQNTAGAEALGERQQTPPGGEKEEVKTNDVVQALIDARNGERFGARASEVERNAIAILEKRLSPADWLELRNKAARGGFGDASEDVVRIASEQIPLSSARQDAKTREDQRVKQKREQFVNDYRDKVQKSFDKVYAQHPELKDPNHAISKEVQQWLNRYVGTVKPDGTIENPGTLAGLLQSPDFPEKLLPLAVEYVNANKKKTIESGDRTAIPSSGAGGGSSAAPKPGGEAKTEVETLRAKLRAMGKVRSGR